VQLFDLAHARKVLVLFGQAYGVLPAESSQITPEQHAFINAAVSQLAEKEKVVAQRAEARWAALIKGDLDTAYTFFSPGSKVATSLALYKTRIRVGLWRGAKVAKVSCEAEICQVSMQITYDAARMQGIETLVPENWIIENGAAWYVYR